MRKIGAPGNPEYGIGAIAEDGTRVFDPEAVAALGIDGDALEAIVARESAELRRRVEAYRGDRPPLALRGRTVIVVDDGVATGVTDTAALRAVRRRGPRRLVLAVPVCAPDSAARLRDEADELVCLIEPAQLYGVGQWYADFAQVSDAEVLAALRAGSGLAPRESRSRSAASCGWSGAASVLGSMHGRRRPAWRQAEGPDRRRWRRRPRGGLGPAGSSRGEGRGRCPRLTPGIRLSAVCDRRAVRDHALLSLRPATAERALRRLAASERDRRRRARAQARRHG